MTPASLKVSDLSLHELTELLASGKFGLATGRLVSRIHCKFSDVAHSVHTLYAHHPYSIDPDFSDFTVDVSLPSNLRRWFKPQAEFRLDGESPFEPLPRNQAPALLEWGLNWAIASSCHQWFSVHAASLERNGFSVILPAPPGSGKSTLCAALALSNWRLLSDELTLIDQANCNTYALARPINLKNASIGVIRKFAPDAIWAPVSYDTAKGHVTHLRPPIDSVKRMLEPAFAKWIVFPRYQANAEPLLTPKSKNDTFAALAQNAFNYHVLGEMAFSVIADLVTRCASYDFVYSRLEDALEVFDWMASSENTSANT